MQFSFQINHILFTNTHMHTHTHLWQTFTQSSAKKTSKLPQRWPNFSGNSTLTLFNDKLIQMQFNVPRLWFSNVCVWLFVCECAIKMFMCWGYIEKKKQQKNYHMQRCSIIFQHFVAGQCRKPTHARTHIHLCKGTKRRRTKGQQRQRSQHRT